MTPYTSFCTGEPESFTITINPVPQIQSFSETVCEGIHLPISPVDVTNGIVPSGTTYTWVIAENSSSDVIGGSASTEPSATIPGSELTLEDNVISHRI